MRILISLLLLCLAIPRISYSKIANESYAALKVVDEKISINLKKDGTFEYEIEELLEIITEEGRDDSSTKKIVYNPGYQKAKVIEAKSIADGKELKVDKKYIDDKPITFSENGFDEFRQIAISYPQVKVGTKLYLKYSFIEKSPHVDKDIFSRQILFGDNEFVQKSFIKVKSEIPLHAHINDPNSILKIIKNKEDGFTEMSIELMKPVFLKLVDETNTMLNPTKMNWVLITSVKTWEELGRRLNKHYSDIFTQKLPDMFEDIKKQAASKAKDVDKINTVTSLLNINVNYRGDWRTVKGQFVPRPLAEIAKTQFADCKDFSAATAAILAKMGYTVYPALVSRNTSAFAYYKFPIANPYQFDHMILKVVSKDNKVYWIDATNYTSMAQGTYEDLAEKYALVTDGGNPKYEKINSENFINSKVVSKRRVEVLPNELTLNSGVLELKGDVASTLAGIASRTSKENADDLIFKWLSMDRPVPNEYRKSLATSDLNDRIVNDIKIDYAFLTEKVLYSTNYGKGVALELPAGLGMIEKTSEYVGDIMLSRLYTIEKQNTYKNFKIENPASASLEYKSKWLDFSRKVEVINKDTVVTEVYVPKQMLIPNEEIKSKEFKDLEKFLINNDNYLLVSNQ